MRPIEAIQGKEGLNGGKGRKGKGRGEGETSHNPGPGGRRGRKGRAPVAMKLTTRNFTRKPGRSASTILGVALSLSLFLSMLIVMEVAVDVVEGGTESARWDYEVKASYFVPENTSDGWSGLDVTLRDVNPGILLPTKVSGGGKSRGAMLYALEDPESSFTFQFEKGGLSAGKIAISRYISEKMDLDVGDTLTILAPRMEGGFGFNMVDVELEVSGIHSNHIGYYLFMDLDSLQGELNLTGMMNAVYLRTAGGETSREFENRAIMTPGISSVTHIEEAEGAMEQYYDLLIQTMLLLALMSAALATAIVYNLFMISASERRREYATMKTLGTSLRRISNLIYLEAAIITVLGVALGTAGGYALAYWMLANWESFEVMNVEMTFSWTGLAAGAGMIVLVMLAVSRLTIRYIDRINIADVIRERSI
jgi:putative ABC transport system permease protein